jgi:hypothetical protein
MGERRRKLIAKLASRTPMSVTARRYGMSREELRRFVERNSEELVRAVLRRAL